MTLPNIGLTVRDGGLGVVPPGAANISTKIGPCLSGTSYQLYAHSDLAEMVVAHGQCKTTEAAAATLVASGPVYVMPCPWTAGNVSSTTHTGTGGATVTAAAAPHQILTLTISGSGGLGVGTFTYRVGTGAISAVTLIPAGGTFLVPGSFSIVTFSSMSYTGADVYTISTTNVVLKNGSSNSDISAASSPLDDYEVSVKFVAGGALASSTFQYSLDSLSGAQGAQRGNWSPVITSTSTGLHALLTKQGAGTGLMITIAGTAVAGDEYTFKASAPYITSTEQNAALAAIQAQTLDVGPMHVVNYGYLCAGAEALAAAADVKMSAFAAAYKYAWAVVECPTAGSIQTNPSGGALAVNAESDATTVAAFASFASNRVMVGGGDCLMISAIDGLQRRRNAAWAIMARVSASPLSQSPAWTVPGSLSGVVYLYRDEQITPSLDAGRLATLRTIQGVPGYYVTRGKMMALSTSDYTNCMNRRVMDAACNVVRVALVPYLNKDLRADTKTGFIDARDARQIEEDVNAKLETALHIGQENRDASGASVAVSRTNNFLATSELIVSVSIIPLGYAETITVTIGFANPAA